MQDNISVLLASILTVIIIVLFPIYNVATRQDSITKNMVVKATTNFVDAARNKGYIEAEDYENYLTEINRTGHSYEVELEVYKPILLETDTANSYEEKYVVDYTDDIIATMGTTDLDPSIEETSVINDDIYPLNDGYKFYVRVKNTNITQAQILLDRLLTGELTERIVVNYGGVVYTNEWAKGEDAETVGANISISRPMDYNEKEFKYEAITDVYDQYLEEFTTIYGLAVRLNDMNANESKIKFLLSYKDVYQLRDESGNILSSKTARENHIKKYFSIIGFEAEVDVEERQATNNSTGTWDYSYMITLSRINYDFENNAYLRGMVQIKAGSADTRAGALGLLNSKEFIITYSVNKPEITMTTTPDVIENNIVTPISGGTNIKFNARGTLVSESAKVEKIVFTITNNDQKIERTVNTNNAGEASLEYKFDEGTGSVSAYAVDSRGNRSETIGYGFIIMNNYLEQSINRNGITEMTTVIIPNATISEYTFTVKLPRHSGKDWWRITGLVRGTTNTWEVINPETGGTVPRGETLRANSANGSDFEVTKTLNAERYTQLKFEYRTDPSHDGRSCLDNATIAYKVKYKF